MRGNDVEGEEDSGEDDCADDMVNWGTKRGFGCWWGGRRMTRSWLDAMFMRVRAEAPHRDWTSSCCTRPLLWCKNCSQRQAYFKLVPHCRLLSTGRNLWPGSTLLKRNEVQILNIINIVYRGQGCLLYSILYFDNIPIWNLLYYSGRKPWHATSLVVHRRWGE